MKITPLFLGFILVLLLISSVSAETIPIVESERLRYDYQLTTASGLSHEDSWNGLSFRNPTYRNGFKALTYWSTQIHWRETGQACADGLHIPSKASGYTSLVLKKWKPNPSTWEWVEIATGTIGYNYQAVGGYSIIWIILDSPLDTTGEAGDDETYLMVYDPKLMHDSPTAVTPCFHQNYLEKAVASLPALTSVGFGNSGSTGQGQDPYNNRVAGNNAAGGYNGNYYTWDDYQFIASISRTDVTSDMTRIDIDRNSQTFYAKIASDETIYYSTTESKDANITIFNDYPIHYYIQSPALNWYNGTFYDESLLTLTFKAYDATTAQTLTGFTINAYDTFVGWDNTTTDDSELQIQWFTGDCLSFIANKTGYTNRTYGTFLSTCDSYYAPVIDSTYNVLLMPVSSQEGFVNLGIYVYWQSGSIKYPVKDANVIFTYSGGSTQSLSNDLGVASAMVPTNGTVSYSISKSGYKGSTGSTTVTTLSKIIEVRLYPADTPAPTPVITTPAVTIPQTAAPDEKIVFHWKQLFGEDNFNLLVTAFCVVSMFCLGGYIGNKGDAGFLTAIGGGAFGLIIATIGGFAPFMYVVIITIIAVAIVAAKLTLGD